MKRNVSALAILATVLQLSGCTFVGMGIGGVTASHHNAEREARIKSGYLVASDEVDPGPESVALHAFTGALIGLAIDAALLYAAEQSALAQAAAGGLAD